MGDRVEGGTTGEIDAWLREGGLVVTASERAARSLAAAYHRARRAEGLTAWESPGIQDWQSFIRSAWEERSRDSSLILNPLQERSLWVRILTESRHGAALLEKPRNRLAALAIEAQQLLCAFAPWLLQPSARGGWDQDAAAFSLWLATFDELCKANRLTSASRLPLALIDALRKEKTRRPPLLLAGFDRLQPIQQQVFEAWGPTGHVRKALPDKAAGKTTFHRAADGAAELAACALWCRQKLAANPEARLLVVSQELAQRRGEIERAFLRYAGANENGQNSARLFEFSLGVPLGKIATVRSGGLLLRWLTDTLEEDELDWLISAGQSAASVEESRGLEKFMRELRRRGMQRTRWMLAEFLRQKCGELPHAAWVERMMQAQRQFAEFARQEQSALVWAELIPQLLESMGWPGYRPPASVEFQAMRRWRQVMDDCASLGFDGRRMKWREFFAALDSAVSETLFAPESQDAPIFIAGPAETAGLTADAVWFLGADEDGWPPRGATHPLLPVGVQREAAMPHASPQVDWELADAMTRRLLASAPEVHFSYAHQKAAVDTRPSRLIMQLAGEAQAISAELLATQAAPMIATQFEDASDLPFAPGKAVGGANVLTTQSQCAFKAFATARLSANAWEPAEAGLTAAERGTLLHAVLHSVWGGPPEGIRTLKELIGQEDLEAFAAEHVLHAFQKRLPARAREAMPKRYLELEEQRLKTLVTEWLRYEQTRVPFVVAATEVDADISIAGLALHIRLDRVDRLNDGKLLVIDYKSGDVSPKSWELPRPEDLQLPLYAEFAVNGTMGELGGLVFAKIRAGGKREFAGRVMDAKGMLVADLGKSTHLVRRPLTQSDLDAWRNVIEELAQEFIAGRASVNPRDYPRTCERCGLQALCRVQENLPQAGDEDETENGEADDE